jgi:hypothetical protein
MHLGDAALWATITGGSVAAVVALAAATRAVTKQHRERQHELRKTLRTCLYELRRHARHLAEQLVQNGNFVAHPFNTGALGNVRTLQDLRSELRCPSAKHIKQIHSSFGSLAAGYTFLLVRTKTEPLGPPMPPEPEALKDMMFDYLQRHERTSENDLGAAVWDYIQETANPAEAVIEHYLRVVNSLDGISPKSLFYRVKYRFW